jgi:hypothetical protein
MRKLLILALIPCFAACVTAAELDERLAVWVGKDADQVASDWGAPSGIYKKKDGGSILTYERMSVITTGIGQSAQTSSRSCRVDFTTDADGKIVGTKWQGAADQCDRSIP